MRKFAPVTVIAMIMLLLSSATGVSAASGLPYITYNYDFWGDVFYTPAAYVPDGNISGEDLGAGKLGNPQDLFVADDGRVYIADTENNRIVVLDSAMKLEKIIDSFDNNGVQDTFKGPFGVFVTGKNELYVADTGNFRIVALNADGSLLKIIRDPKSEVLDADFVFAPLKVAVDYADRVYSVSRNMFQGIMAFDEKSQFTGFTGTIKVTISVYEKIWRRLSTKAQRSRQIQFIPTEFTNVDMAPDGFIYATNIDATDAKQSVRRLNPKGQDVIRKKRDDASLSGDLYWSPGRVYGGPSRIVDVVYRGNGIYSIIDMNRGRIFTYDHEGNLLYIFGGVGTQKGTFKLPSAIDVKDDRILVLDSRLGEIVTFKATEYGTLINEAVALRYNGDEASAVRKWEQVIKLDANFELAYDGIGKAYLAAGENRLAMKYFKLAMDREYYSIAFKRYRDEILKENLGIALTILAALVLALAARKYALRLRKRRKGDVENA
jgi:tetratricopeptide (TPR) repeat protein